MPKALVALLATVATIGLTLVYAGLQEQRFTVYLPYAIRGLADSPPSNDLEQRVAALETQVAQLSALPTPTPWFQTVKALDYFSGVTHAG